MLRLKHAFWTALLALVLIVPVSGFAKFAEDTFTDTAGDELAAAHTPDIGTSWTENGSTTSGELVITDANRVRPNNTGWSVYYTAGTPASAEYDVVVTVRRVTSVADQYIGVVGRAETLDRTWYEAYYDTGGGAWALAARVDNVSTGLGTFSQSLSNDTDYLLKLQIRNATKKLFVDGVERISSSNNDITAAGTAGLFALTLGSASTNSTGLHMDTFCAGAAGDCDGGGGGPAPCRLLLLGVGCELLALERPTWHD